MTESPNPSEVTRRSAALVGVLSGLSALSVGELAGRILPGAGRPVIGVGEWVIAHTSPGVREALIGRVGTADKPLLVYGIITTTVVLVTLLTVLARRREPVVSAGLVVLGILAAVASAEVPGAGRIGSAAAGALAVLAALTARWWLLPPARPTRLGVARGPALDRRRFLARAGLVLVAAEGGVLARQQATRGGSVSALRRSLPAPKALKAPLVVPIDATFPDAGLSSLLTPNASFYRIDTALEVPQVDPRTWVLKLDGLVEHPFSISYDELRSMPQAEAFVTIGCVSNPVGGDLVGTARWQGVLLSDLIQRARPRPTAEQVVGLSVDGYTGGFPLPLALDGRSALVALSMNGEPLPIPHGFPARMIVPGLYGYESAIKWLDSIVLTPATYDPFWVQRGYAKLAPFLTTSRIDTPATGQRVPAGVVTANGMAWAPHRGISRVEVRVDDGAWQPAELASGTLGPDAWRPWRWEGAMGPGRRALTVRAYDGDGVVQDQVQRPIYPSGATGYHERTIRVIA
jgi:DMSO/TMAO reductase YedYZ molybdopterin-dependent catalytic subunit